MPAAGGRTELPGTMLLTSMPPFAIRDPGRVIGFPPVACDLSD